MKQWLIQEIDMNKRIDIFLNEQLELSRTKLNEMIKTSSVRCNQNKIKASYKLKLNDMIEVDDFLEKSHDLQGIEMPLDILYEDEYLCVLKKPKGLVVHPGKGNHELSLLHGLIHAFKGKKPGIVHRLDKDTAGLLVVAKDVVTHAHLSKQVESKMVKRFYCALVHGNMKEETVNTAIGKHPHEKKMMVNGLQARDARTHFTPLKGNGKWTLVQCELFTGRTHQIRVHASSLGHPLIENPLYGIDMDPQGQYLFAYKLKFIHPRTLEPMTFESILPESFNQWMGEHQ